MSGERSLPEQPSLRYLRLEAKRRRAAGEFPTLHHAQLAVAGEHGQPSWAALREAVAGAPAASEGHAMPQLRWIAARFRDAGTPGWTAPADDELRAHFTDQFLANVPPDRLVATIRGVSGELHADLTVVQHGPFNVTGQLSGHLVTATTEPRPPHRISGLAMRRLGERVGDPRAASPATATSGVAPDGLTALAEAALAQLGLPGPGSPPGTPPGPLPGPVVPPAVTGYDVAADGTFTPQPGLVCALPAGGGLWTTAADLVRLGLGWPGLLPRSLAEQVLRPHATQPNGIAVGLGWAVNERAGLAGYAAGGPASAASLLITLDGRHACAALASRLGLLEPVSGQALVLTAGTTQADTGRAEPGAVPGV